MRICRKGMIGAGLALLLPAVVSAAAEYQWSVPVPSATSPETQAPPRAFLWIPPTCARVRAVVLGQHNMLEEPILEAPRLRDELSELGMACVWITPILGGQAQFTETEEALFADMFRRLADVSGYTELAHAPVVPIGHSAMADFPYLFAARHPGRTLAAISIKGSWPDAKKPHPGWTGNDVAGVPLLLVSGEYEWAEERAGKALPFRRAFPAVPFSMLADAGGGHFDSHNALVTFLAVYLRKAALFRLPATPPPIGDAPTLTPIDATRQGWLVDRWRQDKPPRAPAAPVAEYTGDTNETYWCFDAQHALATERLQSHYLGKKPQLLGYVQAGAVVPQNAATHQQVTLGFIPDPDGDGLTFTLRGTFLDTVPEGRPARWTALPAGAPVGHASADAPVVIRRICGPVAKLADDTFALRFDRLGFDNPRRSSEIWLLAEHPGDGEYKRAVQQAVLRFPLRNTAGTPQTITFAPIPDQPAGTRTLRLHATSSANLPVRFYVREGPASVSDDGTLTFSPLPPRTKYPVAVTVVAWQWGRSTEPRHQSATPVAHTFRLNGP